VTLAAAKRGSAAAAGSPRGYRFELDPGGGSHRMTAEARAGDFSMFRISVAVLICAAMAGSAAGVTQPDQTGSGSRVRTYYVAADEVEWDYAPSGMDKMMGMKFAGWGEMFTKGGPHAIGRVYRKAVYREYSDASFSKLKPRSPEWAHLGILGPVLRAEVGDTIRVVFRNNATRPYSMHPHGVFYTKDSEGAVYDDGATPEQKANSMVPPGQTHTYTWEVPERAGPGPADGSSVVWLYHSHGDEQRDINSGLIGAMIITARGMGGAEGRPRDVDREFISLFLVFNVNLSWYLDHNIQTYTFDPKGVDKLEGKPADLDGAFSFIGTGFSSANLRASINGYMYANGPLMTMKKGERVRWYLVSLGGAVDGHTPHWHGNVVTYRGHRTDVVPLAQAEMQTADMVPDNVGTWMYHCHVDEHMVMGMMAVYMVEP
jgi:FtsP/CotA-like multicopper oxidase with cupredoxin domain